MIIMPPIIGWPTHATEWAIKLKTVISAVNIAIVLMFFPFNCAFSFLVWVAWSGGAFLCVVAYFGVRVDKFLLN